MCNITVHFNVTWCLLEGNKCSKGAGGKKEATHYCGYSPPEKRSHILAALAALFSNMFRNTEQNDKQILIFNSSMYHWFARAPQSVLHSVGFMNIYTKRHSTYTAFIASKFSKERGVCTMADVRGK